MLQTRNYNPTSLRREAWLEINLTSLEHNIMKIKSWLDPRKTKIMAVLKADAYGHGALPIAELLIAHGINWLAVASIDEALSLRKLNKKVSILCLSPIPNWAIKTASDNDIDVSITSLEQLEKILNLSNVKNLRIHLKLDTGMHRLGIDSEEIPKAFNLLSKASNIKLISLFSHFAKAYDENSNLEQFNTFNQFLDQLDLTPKPLLHIASSQAIPISKYAHLDIVRPGLYLYGLEPNSYTQDLKPVLSLKARINQLKNIPENTKVGYDYTFTSSRPTTLAVVPIGYADGIDRGLSNLLLGSIDGKLIKQVGLISMDQMIFDITDIKGVNVGDVIELIDNKPYPHFKTDNNHVLSLSSWAKTLNTSTYELACKLKGRLPKLYIRED